jgi:hypothetical protein
MNLLNRWLVAEVLLVHFGHAALYVVALALVVGRVPWWGLAAGTSLILFSLAFWLYEAKFVWKATGELWRRR